MNFKNPEILYALLLLLIPVIIHLVKWKRYKKTVFTNVDFLQELEIKSRKSRKLKELLVLLTRLLAFASLIFAFAYPYFPSKAEKNNIKNVQNIIYLDNSLSMSAIDGKDNFLLNDKMDLIKNIKPGQKYTFFTNDKIFKNISGERLKDILFDLKFSPKTTKHLANIQKINFLTDKDKNTLTNVIYLSDLQNVNNEILDTSVFKNTNHYYFKITQRKDLSNISLDSLELISKTNDILKYKLWISATKKGLKTPIKILQDNHILWNDYVEFKDSLKLKIPVEINAQNDISGKISIEDEGFQFDNNLFFTYRHRDKINILFVGDTIPDFIKKIYTSDEFNLTSKKANEVNYNNLNRFQLVIFYRLDFSKIPADIIKKYVQNYGNIALIPKFDKDFSASYFTTNLNKFNIHISNISKLDTSRVVLNKINFNHPFFKSVFLKKTTNFAYPYIHKHLAINTGNWLYKLNDNTSFASVYHDKGNIYLFNADLEIDNTNFTKAPYLVVPLFYQMAKMYQNNQKPYFVLNQQNVWTENINLQKDKILKLKKDKTEIIPFQVHLSDKVRLTTNETPNEAGIYQITEGDTKYGDVAFNVDRVENRLKFLFLPKAKNISQIASFSAFEELKTDENKANSLWKIFVGLGLFFLLIEFLILKFWK